MNFMKQFNNITNSKEIMTLNNIPLNKEVIIKNITDNNSTLNRLMEMGLIPGEKIKIIQIAPMGDPIEILVMGYKLCIRKKEASYIEVEYA